MERQSEYAYTASCKLEIISESKFWEQLSKSDFNFRTTLGDGLQDHADAGTVSYGSHWLRSRRTLVRHRAESRAPVASRGTLKDKAMTRFAAAWEAAAPSQEAAQSEASDAVWLLHALRVSHPVHTLSVLDAILAIAPPLNVDIRSLCA